MCSCSPRSRTSSIPLGCIRSLDLKTKLRKSGKVLLSTRCAMLRFRLILIMEVRPPFHPNVSFVASAVRLESLIRQLGPFRTGYPQYFLPPALPANTGHHRRTHPQGSLQSQLAPNMRVSKITCNIALTCFTFSIITFHSFCNWWEG